MPIKVIQWDLDAWEDFWSRRIDEEHRLVYAVEDERVIIFACRGHYDD